MKHVGLISMECAPYRLKDGGALAWNKMRRPYAEQCKKMLERYAPNMNSDSILWDYIGTPLDTENKFPDMKNGCFKQGAYLPLQMGYFRPNEYCSQHDSPIRKLYLAGRMHALGRHDYVRPRLQRGRKDSGRPGHREVVARAEGRERSAGTWDYSETVRRAGCSYDLQGWAGRCFADG